MNKIDSLNKTAGCLIGGAAGDALGYPIEFYSYDGITSKFGSNGIQEYKLDKKSNKALISDDTQMTIFTTNGLISCALTKSYYDNLKQNMWVDFVAKSYKAWLDTQNKQFNHRKNIHNDMEYPLWVYNVESLWNDRAPGNTCLESLRKKELGTLEKRINNSKGCGGVMRVAPVGIVLTLQNKQEEFIFDVASEIAALTHGHIDGWAPAGMLALIISKIFKSEDDLYKIVRSSIEFTENYIKKYRDTRDSLLISKSKLAYNLAMKADIANKCEDTAVNDLSNIEKIGKGWTGEEALAIAIYCSLRYKNNFEKAIQTAVNHGGDSDSTGAITGNIVGALLGYKGIPNKFINNLETKDVLLTLAEDINTDIISYCNRYNIKQYK